MPKIRNIQIFAIVLIILAIVISPPISEKIFTADGEIDVVIVKIMFWIAALCLLLFVVLVLKFQKRVEEHIKMYWKNYVLLIIVILMFFVIVEIFLRNLPQTNTFTGSFLLKKNFYVEGYEFDYSVNLNSDYFRDDEFVKKKNKNEYRIFIISDSFIYGAAARENETIDKLLERKINADSAGRDYEVYNLGKSGYDIKGYYEIAKKFKDYGPDIVILSLYVDNDILNSHFSLRNFISSLKISKIATNALNSGGKECIYSWIDDYEVDAFYREKLCKGQINPWFLKRASSLRLFNKTILEDNQEQYNKFIDIFNTNPETKEYILKIKNMYPKSKFLLLINPSKYQLNKKYAKELQKIGFAYSSEDRIVDRKIQDTIISWALSENVNYIDLLKNMNESNNVSYFHYFDDHYNYEGNSFAADEIYESLKRLDSDNIV